MKAITEKQTKTQIIRFIAETTGLTQKEVLAVFQTTGELIGAHLVKRGSGEFVIPETGIKVTRKRKAATKARNGINPKTGESIVIAAKKARDVVKVSALKVLKDTVEG